MKKYYLIGELHGTNESPQVCWEIMNRNNINQLAIEVETKYQKEVDDFLKSKIKLDSLSIFKLKHITKAIKNLLKKSKKKCMKVFCVDDWADPRNRDQAMAKNLMKIKGKVAYLCGGDHASKNPIKIDKSSEWYNLYKKGIFKTCGSYLPKDETVSYIIYALRGGRAYFNGAAQDCKPRPNLAYQYKLSKLPMIVKSKLSGYNFLYIVNKYTLSS